MAVLALDFVVFLMLMFMGRKLAPFLVRNIFMKMQFWNTFPEIMATRLLPPKQEGKLEGEKAKVASEMRSAFVDRLKKAVDQVSAWTTPEVFEQWWRPAMPNLAALEMLLTSTVAGLLTAAFSSTWACLRGTPPHLTPAYSLAGTILICLAMLVMHLGAAASSDQGTVAIAAAAAVVGGLGALATTQLPDHILDLAMRRGIHDAAVRVQALVGDLAAASDGSAAEPASDGAGLTDAELVDSAQQANTAEIDDADTDRWVWVFSIALAVLAAVLSALLVLPAMRVSRTTREMYKSPETPRLQRGLLTVAFFMPAVGAALWLRPVLGDMLLPKDLVKCDASALARDCRVLDTPDWFWTESLWLGARVGLITVAAGLHLYLTRAHLRQHLRRARNEVLSIIDVSLASKPHIVRKMWAEDAAQVARQLSRPGQRSVFGLATAALMHIAPAVLVLVMAAALVWAGGIELPFCSSALDWFASAGYPLTALRVEDPAAATPMLDQVLAGMLERALSGVKAARSIPLVAPTLVRTALSFLLWWTTLSWSLLLMCGWAYWDAMELAIGAQKDEAIENAKAEAEAAAAAAGGGRKRGKGGKRKGARKAAKQD